MENIENKLLEECTQHGINPRFLVLRLKLREVLTFLSQCEYSEQAQFVVWLSDAVFPRDSQGDDNDD